MSQLGLKLASALADKIADNLPSTTQNGGIIPSNFAFGTHSNFESHGNLDFQTERFKQDEQLKDLKSKIREQLEAVKNIQRDGLSDDDSLNDSKKRATKKTA
jgi:hypothetical protein